MTRYKKIFKLYVNLHKNDKMTCKCCMNAGQMLHKLLAKFTKSTHDYMTLQYSIYSTFCNRVATFWLPYLLFISCLNKISTGILKLQNGDFYSFSFYLQLSSNMDLREVVQELLVEVPTWNGSWSIRNIWVTSCPQCLFLFLSLIQSFSKSGEHQ